MDFEELMSWLRRLDTIFNGWFESCTSPWSIMSFPKAWKIFTHMILNMEQPCAEVPMGPSIYDICKFSQFLTPLAYLAKTLPLPSKKFQCLKWMVPMQTNKRIKVEIRWGCNWNECQLGVKKFYVPQVLQYISFQNLHRHS